MTVRRALVGCLRVALLACIPAVAGAQDADVDLGARDVDLDGELIEAAGDLMRLPPLKELLAIAERNSPETAQLTAIREKEKNRQAFFRIANWDLVEFNAIGFAGRQDIFSVTSDGTVFAPTAAVLDRFSGQASVALKWRPTDILQNRAQARISKFEMEALEAQMEMRRRNTAEGVITAYNQASISLDVMMAHADAYGAIRARSELASRLFEQGAMSMVDYAEMHAKTADMAVKYAKARGDFNAAYQLLMERVYGRIP